MTHVEAVRVLDQITAKIQLVRFDQLRVMEALDMLEALAKQAKPEIGLVDAGND